MKRKWSLRLGAAVLCAVLLGSCGDTAAAPAESTAPADPLTGQQLLYPERTGSAPQQQVLVISSDEERELRCALSEHPSDRDAVLKQLGISRATLYRRMKKYGLQQEK